jgi:hypothetical protein
MQYDEISHQLERNLRDAAMRTERPAKKSAIPRDCAEDPPKEEVLEEYVQRAPNTIELCAPVGKITIH